MYAYMYEEHTIGFKPFTNSSLKESAHLNGTLVAQKFRSCTHLHLDGSLVYCTVTEIQRNARPDLLHGAYAILMGTEAWYQMACMCVSMAQSQMICSGRAFDHRMQ